MTMTHLLSDIGNAAIWAAGAAIVVWVVQYSFLAPWWRHAIGITLVGLALVDLLIYLPSLLALSDPADFAGFASTTWYLYTTVIVVFASAVFLITRIVTWEQMRRRRNTTGQPVLPAEMAARIAELEAENAELKDLLGEARGQ